MAYEVRRRRRLPREEDLWEVIEKLEDRMEIYELEHLVRSLSLEDVAKALLLRGHPVLYSSREVYETERKRWEGLIFKRPVIEKTRRIRENRIAGGW